MRGIKQPLGPPPTSPRNQVKDVPGMRDSLPRGYNHNNPAYMLEVLTQAPETPPNRKKVPSTETTFGRVLPPVLLAEGLVTQPGYRYETTSVRSQAPELTDVGLYPEPDWMKRYSTSKTRGRTPPKDDSVEGPKIKSFFLTDIMPMSTLLEEPTSKQNLASTPPIETKTRPNSVSDPMGRSFNPLFKGSYRADKNTPTFTDKSKMMTLADFRTKFTNPLKKTPTDKSTHLANEEMMVKRRAEAANVVQSRSILKKSSTASINVNKNDVSTTPEASSSPFNMFSSSMSSGGDTSKDDIVPDLKNNDNLNNIQKKILFSRAMGPVDIKHKKQHFPSTFKSNKERIEGIESIEGVISSSKGVEESKEKSPQQNFIMKALSRIMNFDQNFNTVYTADLKSKSKSKSKAKQSQQPGEAAVCNESSDSDSGSSNHIDAKAEEKNIPQSNRVSFGATNSSLFKLNLEKINTGVENQSKKQQPQPLSEPQPRDTNGRLLSQMEDTLKSMGIAHRQEGVMDFEAALLLVLMDPAHPFAAEFGVSVSKEGSSFIYDAAIRANEAEIEKMANELSNDHPDIITLKAATADMYKGLGMPVASEVLMRQVVDSHRRVQGSESTECVQAINDLGLLLVSMHKFAEAQLLFEEVVAAICEYKGELHPDTAAALGNLAIALRGQSNFPDAVAVHERCALILEKTVGVDHEETAFQRGQLGITYIQMGSVQKGRRYIQEALSQLRGINNLKKHHPWITSLSDKLEL